MLRRTFISTALALFLIAPAGAASRPGPLKGTGTLEQVVQEVGKRQRTMTSLQADFRQEKTLGLLAQPVVSTGRFLFATPNRVLWEYTAPQPVTMLISDGRLTTYYPDLNRAETLEVTRFQDRIFKYMGPGSRLEDLAAYFDFTFVERAGEPYRLELKPKLRTISKKVKAITIWIERDTYLTTKFEYVEADGDITRYEFSNVRMNTPVAAEKFSLNLPPSVKVQAIKLD